MNLLLLHPEDLINQTQARVGGRRLEHLRTVLRAAAGDEVKAGLLGGPMGVARVLALDAGSAELALALDRPAPAKLPLTLVLALPRPKVLNRVLAAATSLGVARIFLVNAWKVEKSYWKSPRMTEANLLEQRLLGLEQGCDTVLPELHLRRLLRPFAEDELPALAGGGEALVAHPGAAEPCPRAATGPVTLVVGPEGGFLAEEVALLARAGCRPVDLGPRILRVETAVAALAGRLF